MRQIQHTINNQRLDSSENEKSEVLNPATGEQVAEIAIARNKEVELAVSTSKTAFKEWKNTSIAQRTKLLYKFRNLVVQNEQQIAELINVMAGAISAIPLLIKI